MNFDLFIDESGSFMETSMGPSKKSRGEKQQFPSQLAGVLAPSGMLTEKEAVKIMTGSMQSVKKKYDGQFHGNTLTPGDQYDLMVIAAVEILRKSGIQPVRLVNREKVNYGKRIETYTSMVAELILRICETKHKEGVRDINISLFYASVNLEKDRTLPPVFIEKNEYEKRIQEYLAFAAVRHGFAQKASGWRIKSLVYKSGQDDPIMQICDLVSNASHGDFRKCGVTARDKLQSAFGPYDFSMVVNLAIEQVDYYINQSLYGLALRVIAEVLVGDDGESSTDARERLDLVLGKLSGISSISRNSHLMIITEWLGQIINHHRSLELGNRLAQFFINTVASKFIERLADREKGDIDWFLFSLHMWALTACNHQGNINDAAHNSQRLDELLKSLAGKWEHVSIMMEGIIAQAVHLTDCFDHDAAAGKMELVSKYYREISGLFCSEMPGIFPARVVSDLRGKALGTWLQAEMYAGAFAGDAARLKKSRNISDEAIEEFADLSEKLRQYQYRAQLETIMGNFPEARSFLARSLGINDDSHAAIAGVITGLDMSTQGFPLLHWLRLGACCRNDAAEWSAFTMAYNSYGLQNNKWCVGNFTSYFPVHAILRWVSTIVAALGENQPAALGRLRSIVQKKASMPVLSIILVASLIETAGIVWKRNIDQAKRLLDCRDENRPGAKQFIKKFVRENDVSRQKLTLLYGQLEKEIDAVLNADNDTDTSGILSRLGRMIVY